MIEILSRGQGEPEALILRITFVICWYDGGERSYGMEGGEKDGIQLGIVNDFTGLIVEKNLLKNSVHVEALNVGESAFV